MKKTCITYYIYKKAFTLAEVLITLGIIGVVAALTMPALIANHRKTVVENPSGKILQYDESGCYTCRS